MSASLRLLEGMGAPLDPAPPGGPETGAQGQPRHVVDVCRCPLVKHRHGTAAMYSTCGCRCRPCTDAAAKAKADRDKRVYLLRSPMMVNSIGSRRRIQALCRLGYSQTDQSEYLGVHLQTVNAILRRDKITLKLRNKIRRMYNDLSMKPAPDSHRARYARTVAERHGWPAVLDWDDDAIDDPKGRPHSGKKGRIRWEDEFEFLVSCGESEEQALKQLGRTPSALYKKKARAAA